jgi:hypothetical protein
MKKLLGILVLGLLLSNNAYAKTKLKCMGLLEMVEKDLVYVSFDDKTIEIFQGSGGNKLEFNVKHIDEYFVESYARSLEKGVTQYDTHVSDWNAWYSDKNKKHLWWVNIDRMGGTVAVVMSKKPYKKGKKSFKPELIYDWECKKSGLSKF